MIMTMLRLVVVYLKKAVCVVSMLSRLMTGIDNNKPGRSMAYRVRCLCCVLWCGIMLIISQRMKEGWWLRCGIILLLLTHIRG
nr:MAG TPA: hypothetical protein [Caudoviricetes sp.]